MRRTSNGSRIINSPFNENITYIVKSKATSVKGLIFGMNFLLYHSLFLIFINENRVIIPAKNGMPKYIKTLLAISPIVISTAEPCSPK